MKAKKRLAIIGGGLSGSLLGIYLLKTVKEPLDIILFEKSGEQLYKGVAYAAILPYQLLNVPVKGMSLFEDDPLHFFDWLRRNGYDCRPEDFVPRNVFGSYLGENVQAAQVQNKIHQYRVQEQEVIGLQKNGEDIVVQTPAGHYCVDKVFLCTGNFPPGDLPGLPVNVIRSQRYVTTPWDGKYLPAVKPDETVFIAGTGLTMVDQVMSLCGSSFSGTIIASSRRGYLPMAHGETPSYELSHIPPFGRTSVHGLYYWLKNEIARAEDAGKNYRSVWEAIRPHVPVMWRSLSFQDKRLFLKYIRPLWEIHRHRIPTPTADALQELIAKGRLRIIAGRIKSIEQNAGTQFTVCINPRGRKQTTHIAANWILNCTGPQSDHKKVNSPLYNNLFAQGIISMDATGLGIRTTEQGQVIQENGETDGDIIAVGPLLKASLWESTALREIRLQVDRLVHHFASL